MKQKQENEEKIIKTTWKINTGRIMKCFQSSKGIEKEVNKNSDILEEIFATHGPYRTRT